MKTIARLSLVVFFMGSIVQAEEAPTDSDNTNDFHVELANEIKKDQMQIQNILPHIDKGEPSSVGPECSERLLEQDILNHTNDFDYMMTAYKKFFSRCEKTLSRHRYRNALTLVDFATAGYKLDKHPHIKPIQVKNKRGEITPGYIALKPGKMKRPLIIFKCGVFCSDDISTSTKQYFMNLFDQSPFHVLMLSNRTGHAFIKSNKMLTMGGTFEGRDLMDIVDWVRKDSPFKDLIDSVHLVGVSLGGHGAVYATKYNEVRIQENKKAPFDSILPICAAMNLEKTMHTLYKPGIVGPVVRLQTRHHLKEDKRNLPKVAHLINNKELSRDVEDYPDYLMNLVSYHSDGLSASELWSKNNFFNSVEKVSTPTLMIASRDDMVVNYEANTGSVEKSSFFNVSPKVGVVSVNYGNHCAFNSSYGTSTMSSVIRSFVLANSPHFLKIRKELRFSLNKKITLRSGEKIAGYTFHKTEKDFKLTVKIFSPYSSSNCSGKTLFVDENSECLSEQSFPLSSQFYNQLGFERPTNSVHAQALTRAINASVHLMADEEEAIGSSKAPNIVLVDQYSETKKSSLAQK